MADVEVDVETAITVTVEVLGPTRNFELQNVCTSGSPDRGARTL